MRLEVRCCCQPQKLLGSIDVPDHAYAGMSIVYPLQIAASKVDWDPTDASPTRLTYQTVQLSIDVFQPDFRRTGYLAVKAEGVKLEVLRRIASFEEIW